MAYPLDRKMKGLTKSKFPIGEIPRGRRSILEKRNTGPWIMRVTFIRWTVTLPCRARRLRLSRSLGPRRRDTEVRTTSRRERSSFSAHLLSFSLSLSLSLARDLVGRSRERERERDCEIPLRIGKIQGTSDSVRGQNRRCVRRPLDAFSRDRRCSASRPRAK